MGCKTVSAASVVKFRNAQGLKALGSIVDLSSQLVVFEVYDPFSIVRLSEVLSDLSIRQGEREIYRGRAVVTELKSTGMMLLVTAALVEPREGASTFAKMLNASVLRQDAHRSRTRLMTKMLQEEAARVIAEGRRFRVLNFGCGPAAEVRAFIEADAAADRTDMHLVDFNAETLEFVRKDLLPYAHHLRPEMTLEIEQRSLHELLRRAVEQPDALPRQYDLVYCAGLFDYLGSSACSALLHQFTAWTNDGGTVVAANLAPNNGPAFMSPVLDWNFEFRDERALRMLAPNCGYQEIIRDEAELNVCLVIRK